ncbi:MAG: hypothetical protein KJ000_09235 [Pirellulaceae bacterium]|nr:hypothetical protein [Pirellulaceae bacterium]
MHVTWRWKQMIFFCLLGVCAVGRPGQAAAPQDAAAEAGTNVEGRAAAPAASEAIFWCDSVDPRKLDLVVQRKGNRYFMTNVAKYDPPNKNCYYYVNWDLQGTHEVGQPIENVEVEPNSLYLVHLYELSKPKTLGDFWSDDPGKAASAAFVWINGEPAAQTPRRAAGVTGDLTEIRESPRWFRYEKGDRLPIYSQRFPEFRLPPGKVLSLAVSRTEDTFDDCRRRGVSHFQSGGGLADEVPREQRLMTLPTGFFNDGIGEKPSDDPHISPTENAFLQSDPSHAIEKATIAAGLDYLFLDEEFWHNDYHPATIERLCLFAQEAKRIQPALKIADFWNPPPYRFTFMGGDGWTAASMHEESMSHYDNLDAAAKWMTPAMVRRVTVRGRQTSLAEELTAVSQCVYFDNLFGFIGQYDTFSNDFFVPAAIHTTRLNKRMACNEGKPLIWFAMDILEGNYGHPRIPYPTRTTDPPGTAIFHERLMVSPNFNEALALFALLEGDGIYLWEPHGPSDGDPNGILRTLQYCVDYHDDRGEWRPDEAGTPLGKGKTWYPPHLHAAPDYHALGAWKFSQIADVVTHGKRLDFEYSTDGGQTWYVPPANGGTMADVVRDRRPIVTGAVAGEDIAVVVFHPFQGVAETTSLLIRHGKDTFAIELFGTRPRVYRGKTK